MDALGAFLDGPRARGAFLLKTVMTPPWSMRIDDRAPLTLVAVVDGAAWIVFEGCEPEVLHAGDLAVIRGTRSYVVADEPSSEPQIVVHPGQHCTTLDGTSLAEEMALGVRTWGNSASGSVTMLTGTYTTDGEISGRLVDALPEIIVLRGESWDTPLVALLAAEIVNDQPGQEVVLDRLLDLLLIAALRTWFARPHSRPPSWYHANADPVVGPAIRLLHGDPAHPWTVAALAGRVGVSRAALARRFHDVVGEPPMAFLAGWRLAMAADLLRDPEASVTAVARTVGYNSPFTFSTAFKRAFGVSPRAHRDACRSGSEAHGRRAELAVPH